MGYFSCPLAPHHKSVVLYSYKQRKDKDHDQAHHSHSYHRHHTRTHHRLHHRTADSTTARQRTTLHHHHIITMPILPRRQTTRPSRTRHIHRPHRHTMVSRRPKPLQRHRLVTPIRPTAPRLRRFFYTQNNEQQKTTKTNKTKHTIHGSQQTKRGGKATHSKPPSPGTLMSFSRGRSAQYWSVRSDSGLCAVFLGLVKGPEA